ncbi:helix-turn-helix domain-containing protein [Listeria kieliensis]
MLNYLLKGKITELAILRQLDFHPTRTAEELRTSLQLTRSTLQRKLQNLKEDLQALSKDLQISIPAPYTYQLKKNASLPDSEVFQRLQLHYLKQSPIFRLMVIVLTSSKPVPFSALLDQLFVSPSYLARLIKQANIELEVFNLQLDTTKENTIYLKGQEHPIRLFSFLFLTYSFQQIEWPFSSISQTEILQQAHSAVYALSETQQSFYCYLFAIWELRKKQGTLSPLPNEKQAVLTLLCEKNDLSYGLYSSSKISSQEFEFFNLYIRVFISDSIPVSLKQQIATLLDRKKNRYLFLQDMQQLGDYFIDFFQLQLKESTRQYFSYFFTINCLLLQTISGKTNPFFQIASNFEDLSVQTNDKHSLQIQHFLDNLKQHQPDWQTNYHLAPNVLYTQDMFYTLLKLTYKPSIRVFVQFTKNLMGRAFLMTELHALFQPERIQFVHHIEQADLIISDTTEHQPDVIYFFMDNIFAIDQWRALLNLIQDQLLQQTFLTQKERE